MQTLIIRCLQSSNYGWLWPIPLEAKLLKDSPADTRKMCVCVCPHALRKLRTYIRGDFRKRRLTKTPRRHRLADGQLSSLYAPLPSLSSMGAASVMMCCSARPASSSAPSVVQEDRIGRKYKMHSSILGPYDKCPSYFHIIFVYARYMLPTHVPKLLSPWSKTSPGGKDRVQEKTERKAA